MSNEIDLKELERKAFRSIHQDGIMDIFIGIIIISMGVYGALSGFGIEDPLGLGIYIILEVVALFIFIASKKYITKPRIGIVKPGPARKKKLNKVQIVLFISLLFGIVIILISMVLGNIGINQPLPWYLIAALFAFNVFVVFGLIAHYTDNNRLYVIAVLFALTLPFLEILKMFSDSPFNTLVAFGIPGVIVICMGITYLIRFLDKYPIPKEEEIANAY